MFIATALGLANFEANVVTSCLTGFTILPLAASLAGAGQLGQNDLRAEVLANPTTQRFMSIAVAYPRPTSFAPRRRIILTSAPASAGTAPPRRAAPGSLNKNIFTVIKRVPLVVPEAAAKPAPAAPAGPAPGAAASAPTAPAAAAVSRLQNLRPLALHEAQFFNSVAGNEVGITNLGGQRAMNFSVEFSNNDIYAVLPGFGSLWALLIVDIANLISAVGGTPGPNTETTFGMLTLTGNRLRNDWLGVLSFTVSVMVDYCAATGNVILNQSKQGGSLAIAVFNTSTPPVNIALAAVTGNVLKGITFPPPRTAATLPDWTTYNCVLP